MKRRVYFILFPGCEVLDLAGPVQALYEAEAHGAAYDIRYCGTLPSVTTAQQLTLSALEPLPSVAQDDWVMLPGFSITEDQVPAHVVRWLREVAPSGARLCSICTGAFILGEAGLLDGKRCTTHWKRIPELRQQFPRARVLDDRLYVEDGTLVTSAGIAAGIDMTLGLLAQDAGPVVAAAVAREMVVYMRRDGSQQQSSVYLDFQQHMRAGVHHVQQYLIKHPESRASIADLAEKAHMSTRHFTRTFREATGISVGTFRQQLRVERARTLLLHSPLSIEAIAEACGFADARQLRRLWKEQFDCSPSTFRKADKVR